MKLLIQTSILEVNIPYLLQNDDMNGNMKKLTLFGYRCRMWIDHHN